MKIQILLDMNLSPAWVPLLTGSGIHAVHWSAVGDPRATDREIVDWAIANSYWILTHDLDFGTLLALTHQTGPSVIQLRAQDILPEHLGTTVLSILQQYESELASGALVVIDDFRHRVRVLPL